ncbi:MAG: hypothetical protein ACXWCN_13755, partial [Caldimonas sp.]
MAALALGVLPALGIGGTAAAGAAGAAGLLSTLQGVSSIVGIIGTLGKGFSDAAQTNAQADQATLQAGQEAIGAAGRETQMKRELLRVLGENDVAFAAGGTDTSQGIAADARAAANKNANDQIALDQQDSQFQQALLRARARNLRSAAGAQVGGALLGAFGQGIDYGIDVLKRGNTAGATG